MKYKGYLGHVEYDNKSKILYGEVIGIKDVVTFQAKNVDDLEQSFKDSVDEYLAWCHEKKEKPEKTFSGIFNLRINPELHAKLSIQAERLKISLNTYIEETLTHVIAAIQLLKKEI
jgi:predicted HicB family RNase H-like nuclease